MYKKMNGMSYLKAFDLFSLMKTLEENGDEKADEHFDHCLDEYVMDNAIPID